MLSQLLFGWLTKDGEGQFSGRMSAGIQGMTGNTNFTTLAPAVTVVGTSYDSYLLAKADATHGGVEQTAIRNARRGDLVELVRGLISNINAIGRYGEAPDQWFPAPQNGPHISGSARHTEGADG